MTKKEMIENQILLSIENNVYRAGERIPAIREMADIHQVSVTTVLAAYRALEYRGYLEARPQSGYYVTGICAGISSGEALAPFLSFDFETDEQSQLYSRCSKPSFDSSIEYNYSILRVPSRLTDRETILGFLAEGMLNYRDRIDSLCLRQDLEPLTNALSKQLHFHNLVVNPNAIKLTFGFVQTIKLALEACCHRGDVAAVECPGDVNFYFALKLYGIQLRLIRCDPRTGLDLDEFESAVEGDGRIRCVLCSPNFSCPTGALMPYENKQRLADFCTRHDIAIIENDFSGEYFFSLPKPASVKSLAPEQVIHIANVENSLTNVCYVLGGKYHQKLRVLSEIARSTVPAFLQEGLALYIQSNKRAGHLKVLRELLRESVQAIHDIAVSSFPEGTRVTCPQGGLHLWIELPKSCNALDAVSSALDRGVSFASGSMFSSEPVFNNCLCINCCEAAGRPSKLEGIRILGGLFRDNRA